MWNMNVPIKEENTKKKIKNKKKVGIYEVKGGGNQ